MINKWRNYALKDGKVKESYIREYCNRSPKRKAAKASNCYCLQQSGKEQKEIGSPNESSREEKLVETHQQGQQGIQISIEGRPEIEERNHEIKTKGKVMKKEKETAKHKKHEASESKAYEKKEDKKEKKEKKK